MFQKICIPQERNNIRASENDIISALTHVDSWHRTVYPIFLQSKSCDFIKTAYFKSSLVYPNSQKSLPQYKVVWSKATQRTQGPLWWFTWASAGAWDIPWQVFILLGPLQDSLAPLLALAVYNFLKQHLHTEVSARSSGFLAHIPWHAQNRSRKAVSTM